MMPDRSICLRIDISIDYKYFCANRSSSIAATSSSVGAGLSVFAMPMRLAAKPLGLAAAGDWNDWKRALVFGLSIFLCLVPFTDLFGKMCPSFCDFFRCSQKQVDVLSWFARIRLDDRMDCLISVIPPLVNGFN